MHFRSVGDTTGDNQWTNVAVDVPTEPGANISAVTKILNIRVTPNPAKPPGGIQRGNAQELGAQSRPQDVGGALEVLKLNMPLSALKQWWALQM